LQLRRKEIQRGGKIKRKKRLEKVNLKEKLGVSASEDISNKKEKKKREEKGTNLEIRFHVEGGKGGGIGPCRRGGKKSSMGGSQVTILRKNI